jgi:hypothetical protein
MRILQPLFRILALALGVAALCGAANITYNVSLFIGNGSVAGTITTDGTIGVLSRSNFVSWNLGMTDGSFSDGNNGFVTLTNSNSVLTYGGSVTATAGQLTFNFNTAVGYTAFYQSGGNLGTGVCWSPSPITCLIPGKTATGISMIIDSDVANSQFVPESGTYQIARVYTAPSIVSLSPTSGSGTSVTFTAVISDLVGASDIFDVSLLVNTSLNFTQGCLITYTALANELLLDQNVSNFLTPGGTGTLSDSRCTLKASSSSATLSGNNLTLKISLDIVSSETTQGVFLVADNSLLAGSGWSLQGKWTPFTSAGPPSVVSLSPDTGSGKSAVFTAVYSDGNGTADLGDVLLLANTSFNVAGGCFVRYDPQANRLYLSDDAGTTWLSPALTPGGGGTLSNSQCTLNASSSSVGTAGTKLTLKASLTFAATVESQALYLFAVNLEGQDSGWVQEGSWTPAPSLGPPAIVSLAPTVGTGETALVTAVYSDPNGAADLSGVLLLVNAGLSATNACFVYYAPQTNEISLANDAGTAFVPPVLTPGVSGTVGNSQCALNAGSSSVSKSGNDLTLKVSLTFASGFTGVKDVFLSAFGLSNQSSGWVLEGAWTP